MGLFLLEWLMSIALFASDLVQWTLLTSSPRIQASLRTQVLLWKDLLTPDITWFCKNSSVRRSKLPSCFWCSWWLEQCLFYTCVSLKMFLSEQTQTQLYSRGNCSVVLERDSLARPAPKTEQFVCFVLLHKLLKTSDLTSSNLFKTFFHGNRLVKLHYYL